MVHNPIAVLDEKRPVNAQARGLGPMAALRSVAAASNTVVQRRQWLACTRLDALLGATRLSQKSVKSGVRCWMAFVGALA